VGGEKTLKAHSTLEGEKRDEELLEIKLEFESRG